MFFLTDFDTNLMEKIEMENAAGQIARKIVSIRFSPGGFSFHLLTEAGIRAGEHTWKIKKESRKDMAIENALHEAGLLNGKERFDAVYLFPETERSVLVPDACFEPETAVNYLLVNGFTLETEETAIVSTSVEGVRAVMALSRETATCFGTLFPGIRYFSPLQLLAAAPESGTTRLLMLRSNIAIAAFSNSLQYAETLPYPSVADALYYLNRLPSELQKNRIVASGLEKSDLKILRRYHKVEEEDFVTLLSRFDAILGEKEHADHQR